MLRHPDQISVQYKGCVTLCNLAGNAENRKIMAGEGCIQAVVASLLKHRAQGEQASVLVEPDYRGVPIPNTLSLAFDCKVPANGPDSS